MQSLRRASARVAFQATARIEGPVRVGTFRVVDISFGGMHLVGDGRGFQLGGGVYVNATDALSGARIAAWAVVVRIDGANLGLEWAGDDPLIGAQLARVIDTLTMQRRRRLAHTVPRKLAA
jgi:hypothetical protein